MESLYFGVTGFAGPNTQLPPNLREYDNSFSLISGLLSELGLPDTIEYVVLDGNDYRSSIPTSWGSLPNLAYLYIADAFVEGTLEFFENVPPKLFECWVDLNPNLGGPIPTEIGLLPELTSFSVIQSGLTGAIPTELGNSPKLSQLFLYSNELSGMIPTEIGNVANLQILQLEDNFLTGAMPNSVCSNIAPSGILFRLGADCEDGNVEVACECCTCCSRSECG